MAYANSEGFEVLYGMQEALEISNLESPDAEAVNYSRLSEALCNASLEIDGYLGARYEVPITAPTPPILQMLCLAIARYRLDIYRRREDVSAEYERAIAQLEKMATGKIALARANSELVPPKVLSQDRAFGDISCQIGDRIWTRSGLKHYQRSPKYHYGR